MPTIKRHGEEFKKDMLSAVQAMPPEAQQRLVEELDKDEGAHDVASPRTSRLRS